MWDMFLCLQALQTWMNMFTFSSESHMDLRLAMDNNFTAWHAHSADGKIP